ncbi:general transcription factor 3C polypeptide 2 isoform X2 [Pungitius pungitius]|uniref:general transcription factor 3C polypeptide 2 isoform X2 n=1 Tax=Pungitius pungitius TaxID=134920 RepID=UPI002E13430A
MDPTDPGPEDEKPPCSTPSSGGRQRQKNRKYSDFETYSPSDGKSPKKEPQSRLSAGRGRGRGRGRGGASKRTAPKTNRAENPPHQIQDGEPEAPQQTPQDSDCEPSEDTPEKVTRAKRTPAKKTPAKKTPAKKTPAKKTPPKKTPAKKTPAKKSPATPAAAATTNGAAQLENGTPRTKRKYVRKQPVAKPACEEAPPPDEPEQETTPSGRPRRGAAKAALKYLHILAKEVLDHPGDVSRERTDLKGGKGSKGRKRKRLDSGAPEDEDFHPGGEVEEEEQDEDEEEEEEEEAAEKSSSDSEQDARPFPAPKINYGPNLKTANGLSTNVMKVSWEATDVTKKFREEHHSSWVFPEWIPSTSTWHLVPPSDLEDFLPQERQSVAFRVSREGLEEEEEEETPLQRLGRFTAAPTHPDRWDTLLYAGGPVWALEWCPTPDGAPASQYVALSCHRGMDDRHCVDRTHSGKGLVQLWELGRLEYNCSPERQPALAYGLSQDKGFIWLLKWCPAGGWELPTCGRKAPFLPRLGLLAVATSTGVVTVYSLPHPDALHAGRRPTEAASEELPIYQAEGVLTLKLGSLNAPRQQRSGQVLSMDWLPQKPHNVLAVGFYDGVVGLWDLSTKSALLRLRESESLTLLPYRCLMAHDHSVRALAFCPASSSLLITAGDDRYVKKWDLRRPHQPILVQKRFLTNEVFWPLNAPGLLLAQENAYTGFGSQGVHYMDHQSQAIFAVPRTGTVWSISYTEWLNSVATADSFGEVILSLLPHISTVPAQIKRTLDRRFPVCFTSLMSHDATEEEKEKEEKEKEGETEGPSGGNESGGDGGKDGDAGGAGAGDGDAGGAGGGDGDAGGAGGGDGGGAVSDGRPSLRIPMFKDAARSSWLLHTDSDPRTFKEYQKRALWKRMAATEFKTKLNVEEAPLVALHKVRFSPNMCSHTWVVAAGQSGLVRVSCLRSMVSSQTEKVVGEAREQFAALYSPSDPEQEAEPAGGSHGEEDLGRD